jgi:hypothetical protein
MPLADPRDFDASPVSFEKINPRDASRRAHVDSCLAALHGDGAADGGSATRYRPKLRESSSNREYGRRAHGDHFHLSRWQSNSAVQILLVARWLLSDLRNE